MIETKVCKDCGIEKPLSEFSRCGKKGRGIRSRCRLCHNARERAKAEYERTLRPSKEVPTTRTCKQCGAVKPLAEFPFRRKRGIDYRSHLCANCFYAKKRATRPSIAKPGWKPPRKPFTDPITGIEMKRCRHCEIDKPLTEYGWRLGKRVAICKSCTAEKRKVAYDADPEKYRTMALGYARRNPEKVRVRKKRYQAENRDRLLIAYQRYNDEHREKRHAYERRRRANRPPGWYKEDYQRHRESYLAHRRRNKAKYAKYEKEWRQKNPEKHAEKEARRRARKKDAPLVESIDRLAIIERDNSTCYLCNRLLTPDKITFDHVIPLSRGGNHTVDNLRVACISCNCRKGTKLLEELNWV